MEALEGMFDLQVLAGVYQNLYPKLGKRRPLIICVIDFAYNGNLVSSRVVQFGVWAHFKVRELARTFPNLFFWRFTNFKDTAVKLAESAPKGPLSQSGSDVIIEIGYRYLCRKCCLMRAAPSTNAWAQFLHWTLDCSYFCLTMLTCFHSRPRPFNIILQYHLYIIRLLLGK